MANKDKNGITENGESKRKCAAQSKVSAVGHSTPKMPVGGKEALISSLKDEEPTKVVVPRKDKRKSKRDSEK